MTNNNLGNIIENVKNRVRRTAQTIQSGNFRRQFGQGQILQKVRAGIAEVRTTRFGQRKSVSNAERTFQIGDGRPKQATKDVLDIMI